MLTFSGSVSNFLVFTSIVDKISLLKTIKKNCLFISIFCNNYKKKIKDYTIGNKLSLIHHLQNKFIYSKKKT